MIKRTKLFKASTLKNMGVILSMLLMFVVTGCSGSTIDDDEPEIPSGDDDTTELGTIPPSILPGQWVIESFTPEDGTKQTINYPFTILDFDVRQTDKPTAVVDNTEMWGEKYDPLFRVMTVNGIKESTGLICYMKKVGANVSTSQVYSLMITLKDYEETGIYVVTTTDLTFKDNVLSAYGGYDHHIYGELQDVKAGEIKLRKIK